MSSPRICMYDRLPSNLLGDLLSRSISNQRLDTLCGTGDQPGGFTRYLCYASLLALLVFGLP